MAKHTMNKDFRIAAALLCAPLMLLPTACHQPAETPPLAGARIGGPFNLIDQDGRRFDSRQLAGRYPVIYFGYTFCPDVCPTDMQNLGKGMRALEKSDPDKAAKVQPIFISIDPARDTPAVLKQYVAAFYPRLIGLTGSEAEIAAVAKEYVAPYQKVPAAPGATGYLMQHSSIAILFGPDGGPIAMVPVDANADAVAATLRKWVK